MITLSQPPDFRSSRFIWPPGLRILALAVVLTGHAQAAGTDAHVFGNPDVWQWPPSRTYHVENYKLTLRFDAPKGEVFGDEVVTLQSLGAQLHEFDLDSSELSIDSVALELPGRAPVS
jgi:hypothetical protein